jgi:hypothetical protein
MATAKALDKEASAGERPQRPAVAPAAAPHSPILPDPPDTPGVKQALEAERGRSDSHVPPGGLPEGIPHADRRPGAKPASTTK